MLTANELASMAETCTDALPDTVNVLRLTRASDSAGGKTRTWATHATVAARVSPSATQGQEPELGARAANVAAWTITVPAGTDVTTADQIGWGTRRFEIRTVGSERSWELDVRLGCVEVI